MVTRAETMGAGISGERTAKRCRLRQHSSKNREISSSAAVASFHVCCFVCSWLALIPSTCIGLCQFPVYLQSNKFDDEFHGKPEPSASLTQAASPLSWTAHESVSAQPKKFVRDWRGGIREQGTISDFRLTIEGSTMSLDEAETVASVLGPGNDGRLWRSNYRRECLETITVAGTNVERYLVRHQDSLTLQSTTASTSLNRRPSPHGGNLHAAPSSSDSGNDDVAYDDIDYQHQTLGQTQQPLFRYACVEFIRRSSIVIQIRSSTLVDWKDPELCADSRMSTDRRLFVDYAADVGVATGCSLPGGFSVRLFESGAISGQRSAELASEMDVDGSGGICSDTRLESECESSRNDPAAGSGFHFYFRSTTCLPRGLYMYPNQPTVCLASWTDASETYTYTVLRHDRLEYRWLFQRPAVLIEDSFIAHLYSDLAVDEAVVNNRPSDIDPAAAAQLSARRRSSQNWRIDAVRDVPRPVSSLCVDESEMCHDWVSVGEDDLLAAKKDTAANSAAADGQPHRPDCARQMALACPRSCGVCNESRPVVCSFRPELIGEWISMSDYGLGFGTAGGSGAAESVLIITVNETTMTFRSGNDVPETFHCVTWSSPTANSGARSSGDETMLVTERFDGCRPRYVCVRHQRRASSLFQVRLSHRQSWPLVTSPDQPIDCRLFSFDQDDSGMNQRKQNRRQNFARLFYSRDYHDSVPCRIPASAQNLVNFTLTYADGNFCTNSSLVSDPSKSTEATGFRLKAGHCVAPDGADLNLYQSASWNHRSRTYAFRCSKSTRFGPSANDDGVLIIARSTETPIDVRCLVIYERPEVEVIWLSVGDCLLSLHRQLRRDRITSPLAILAPPARKSRVGAEPFRRRSDDEITRRGTDISRPSMSRNFKLGDGNSSSASPRIFDIASKLFNFTSLPDVNSDGVIGENGKLMNGTVSESDSETTNVFVLLAAVLIFALLHVPCSLCSS